MRKLIISLTILSVMGYHAHAQKNKNGKQIPMNSKTTTPNKTEVKKTKVPSTVKSFNVDGIRVLLKPTTNDVISVVMFISGGVKNYSPETEGIENLSLNVLLDGGSKKFPKDKFHDLTEQKGISIGASSAKDYSSIAMKTITKNWALSWDIYRDVITNPDWNEQSFKQTKEQTIAGLKQADADPDNYLNRMAMDNTFKNSSYAADPEGSPEAVNKITFDQIKQHYSKIAKRKKMVLVVVGKVDENDLKQKIHEAFASMPDGVADKFESNPVVVNTPSLTSEEREIKTNYMMGILSAPKLGTHEGIAMRIAMSILAERLFIEVRTKRNLSYAPSAYMASIFNPYAEIYVTTTKPNEAAQVMMDEIRKIKKDGFSEKELRDKKEGYLTGYYMGMETNDGQATTLGLMELRGNWEMAENIKDVIYSLTLEDVNNAMKTYATSVAWYYLGDKDKVDEAVFKAALN
ncbi:MAG: pitrilysin family protein [Bacteroidetes bacterium]|nr:pitrilysin family protein [Bacteroidota bacterium]